MQETPTAKELWNDIPFLKERMWEQQEYVRLLGLRLFTRQIDSFRFHFLKNSAFEVYKMFESRLNELTK